MGDLSNVLEKTMNIIDTFLHWPYILLGIALIALVVGVFKYLIPEIKEWRRYIRDVATSGYLPPPPTRRGMFRLKILSRLILFIQVGKVKIIGQENLEALDGKNYIATPNHPHFADVAVLPYVMGGRPARYMAARGVMTFGRGLGSLIFGPMGAFAADLSDGGGAREAAVRVVSSRQILGMFPEGWAYLDGVMGEFKTGAVRIGSEASEILGEEVYFLPMYFRYGKYPGPWIRKVPPPAEYFLLMLLFPFYRRGVTVVIGEPIARSEMSDDRYEATEQLRESILKLDPEFNS